MDPNTQQLIRNALAGISAVGNMLTLAAMGGARAKPTVAQLNDAATRLKNARTFLRAALQDRGA